MRFMIKLFKHIYIASKYRNLISFSMLLLISSINFSWATSIIDQVETFSNLPGASGFEGPVRHAVLKKLTKEKGVAKIDGIGNILFTFNPLNPNKKTVLIMAHMDEVGFIINEVDKQGYIHVSPLGGWSTHALWAHSWLIETNNGSIPAVSGIDSPHVLTDFTKAPKVSASQMFLDTGLNYDTLIKRGVRPGLSVVPDTKFKKIGRYYEGKALDDRLGIALLLSLIETLSKEKDLQQKINIAFAFTTQEELGARGSKTISASIKPNVVFNIEAGIAHDYPMQFGKNTGPKLGSGPSFFIYDNNMIPDQDLVDYLISVAKKNNIPFQWESEPSYSQDGASLQQSGTGSAAINIGIPIRYAHSHIGLFQLSDLLQSKQLLLESLKTLPLLRAMQ